MDVSASVMVRTAALLWEGCRPHPDAEAVVRAIEDGADLGWAVRAATDQRVAALLWRALGASGARDTLGPDERALRTLADTARMEEALLLPAAVSLAVQPLTDVGLQPVVFKGPAVAARYPAPGLRPMDDIDLLLPRSDHPRALDALGRAGWHVVRTDEGDHYDTVLAHTEVPSFLLELHHGLGLATNEPALHPETLWGRRHPLDCFGTTAFGLPLAEEVVVLASHAGKPHHRFVRMVWIADLAMIVEHARRHDISIDWERVQGLARAGNCQTVVATALGMAGHAGLEVPEGMFPLPTTRGARGDALRRMVSVTWPLDQGTLTDYRFTSAVTDRRSLRARMLVEHLVLGHGLRNRARRRLGLPRRRASVAGT